MSRQSPPAFFKSEEERHEQETRRQLSFPLRLRCGGHLRRRRLCHYRHLLHGLSHQGAGHAPGSGRHDPADRQGLGRRDRPGHGQHHRPHPLPLRRQALLHPDRRLCLGRHLYPDVGAAAPGLGGAEVHLLCADVHALLHRLYDRHGALQRAFARHGGRLYPARTLYRRAHGLFRFREHSGRPSVHAHHHRQHRLFALCACGPHLRRAVRPCNPADLLRHLGKGKAGHQNQPARELCPVLHGV